MKIYCLPFAGGGATPFRALQRSMPAPFQIVPLCPPGRDMLFGEPLIDNIAALVRWLEARHFAEPQTPYALYGHSMGSLVAFELTRLLARSGRPLPCHLFVAARGAPALSGEYERLSTLDDDGFLKRLKFFGGLSDEALASPDLMALMLPVLRNDFRLLDGYAHVDGKPLPVPITSFHGDRDLTVREEWIQAWRTETSAAYDHHVVPGGHFFMTESQEALSRIIAHTLRKFAVLDQPAVHRCT